MQVQTAFDRVLETSWQASVLIILILILQRLLRRHLNARWRAAFWLLVLTRLVLPHSPDVSWSLFNYAQPATAAAIVEGWRLPAAPEEPQIANAPVMAERTAARPHDLVGKVSRWAPWLWLAGMAMLMLRLLVQNTGFAWRIRHAPVVENAETLKLLTACRERLRVRTPLRLVETDCVSAPALYGLWRWRLLLPIGLMNNLTPEQQRYVLLHELAHLKRRDPLVNWALIVLRAVHWFNPLVWLAYRCVRRDRELACDETVLANTQSEGKERYGHTIIRILELASRFSGNPALRWKPAVTGIVENKEQIEERITMIARFKSQAGRSLLAALIFVALGIVTLTDGCSRSPTDRPQAATAPPAPPVDPSAPPRIVSTTPAIGATEVDPGLPEITVTFDRDMGEGFSWTGGGPEHPPGRTGQKPHWRDRRTCVLPVTLAAGRYYRVGINSPSYRNFTSVEGVPVEPVAIYFTTAGASQALTEKTIKPQVLKFSPANGARDVDPNLSELRITFNVAMGGGFSWTGSGPQFPPGRQGKRPYWTDGGKTCVLPVQLEPGHDYRLGLNSPSHKNFRSAAAVPLDPVTYTFRTK